MAKRSMDEDIYRDTEWDAGSIGCGEFVLLLGARMKTLPLGTSFKLIAQDPGAVEDIPAWCRMTGNVLRNANHPEYIIERKRG